MTTPLKFTKQVLEQLPLPESGRTIYLDTAPARPARRDAITGLQMVVSCTGVKSFVLCRKLHGRVKKVTISRFLSWTVDMTRKEALNLITTMNQGVDPIKERRASKFRVVTAKETFNDYSMRGGVS